MRILYNNSAIIPNTGPVSDQTPMAAWKVLNILPEELWHALKNGLQLH